MCRKNQFQWIPSTFSYCDGIYSIGSQYGIVPITNYVFRDEVGTHYEPPLNQSFIYYLIILIILRDL